MLDLAIVGGGPGGLMSAWYLKRKLGNLCQVTIFEASDRLGGKILTRKFDSVMFCLSKGLGAPVGSMLVGSRSFIDQARSVRKALGGGMRQAGVLAAAGLIALEEMPKRLHEDHANARFLAEALAQIPKLKIHPEKVKTNIVIFDVSGTGMTSDQLLQRLRDQKVIGSAVSDSIVRLLTHMDVTRADCEQAAHVRDIENAGALAHRVVLFDDALVLDRHSPAGEGDDSRALLFVQVEEWRLAQRRG